MQTSISELRVMVGVLLALVVLLLMGVVALLLRPSSSKMTLPVFFRRKNEGRASIEKPPPPPSTRVPNENRNSTVVRIADYQVPFTFSCFTVFGFCAFCDFNVLNYQRSSFSLCNGIS